MFSCALVPKATADSVNRQINSLLVGLISKGRRYSMFQNRTEIKGDVPQRSHLIGEKEDKARN